MARGQRILKPQRKTIYFEGARTTKPRAAQEMVRNNKEWLRHAYIAYGLLRGRLYEQIESNAKINYNKHAVGTFVEKYSPEAIRISA